MTGRCYASFWGSQSSPFRISSSYRQPSDQDTATFDPLFTTNCTLGSSASPQITLLGQYQCHQGPEIAMTQKCDFSTDCPLGDDEGEMCRQFLNGTYCSFEDGDCGWRPVSPRGPKWRVIEAQPGGATPGCPFSGAVMTVNSSQSKGQQGAASLRSPLFPPPLRNSRCEVRFWLCSGGRHREALSLLVAENGTGPEKLHRLWHTGIEAGGEPGWRLVTVPLYNLKDWFWLQFSTNGVSGQGSYFKLDNFSLSMDCFLTSNGEFPPVVTRQNITTTTTPELPDHSSRWIFHTCGASGPEGPSRVQCANSYRNSNVNVTVVTEGPLKGVQVWRVPETRTYRISGYGAAGGRSVLANTRSHGVYIMADFLLQRDELLYILVGQQGEDACPNPDIDFNKICTDQVYNKTLDRPGGGGGGGGATYVFKVSVFIAVIAFTVTDVGEITTDQTEVPDFSDGEGGSLYPCLSQPGPGGEATRAANQKARKRIWTETHGFQDVMAGQEMQVGVVAGMTVFQWHKGENPSCTGVWEGKPVRTAGQPEGATEEGEEPVRPVGEEGGGSMPGKNDPRKEGKDGSSYIGPDGATFMEPLKGMESHGEVIIGLAQNCSHCESGECHDTGEETACLCDEDLVLDEDGVSCVNDTERNLLTPQLPLSKLALGLSVGTSALIAALLLAVSGVMIMYRRKHTELQAIQLELQSPDCKLSKLRASTIMTDYNPNYCFAGKTASITDLKEVPRRNISLTRGLGHGAFGEVYEGLAVGIPGEPSPMQVAVKTLPEVCSEQDELDFVMEALIISKFTHQNIVRCIGVSLQALPRFILLELMAGGDLKSFLRETRPRLEQPSSLSMVDLLNVARDIARGCQYLEENQFIHRDIAARNCLLTCKGPSRVAKIGDFGMARDIYRASYYRKGGRAMLPVKWMPPEAFMEGGSLPPKQTHAELCRHHYVGVKVLWGSALGDLLSGIHAIPQPQQPGSSGVCDQWGQDGPSQKLPRTSVPDNDAKLAAPTRGQTQLLYHPGKDDYCLQDPDVVTVPLPVEYGPVPEEEERERAAALSEDPVNPALLEPVPKQEGKKEAEPPPQPGHAPQPQPTPAPTGQPHPHPHPHPPQASAPAKPHPAQQVAEGGHVNLGFSQSQPPDKNRNGKPTNLWNPTYGSWFLQQQQQQRQRQELQQRQAGGRAPRGGPGAPRPRGPDCGGGHGSPGLAAPAQAAPTAPAASAPAAGPLQAPPTPAAPAWTPCPSPPGFGRPPARAPVQTAPVPLRHHRLRLPGARPPPGVRRDPVPSPAAASRRGPLRPPAAAGRRPGGASPRTTVRCSSPWEQPLCRTPGCRR
ncbi:hypothetical protein SKAU_G00332850 [Synaphobranchus kaupii]|uniref:Tyrosine-protein kinase receptor n=1 Tax=Synaphobranchus kaupii TaxID=118154 RepID=A0A9Q1IIR7_SYNKA|nr:hypothetical protein SKAU_G00332850 [Synaphobranchus kaupii]